MKFAETCTICKDLNDPVQHDIGQLTGQVSLVPLWCHCCLVQSAELCRETCGLV